MAGYTIREAATEAGVGSGRASVRLPMETKPAAIKAATPIMPLETEIM